ncbi:MAG: M10 family metallopeptidase [Pseudomonadota bacterium]
MSDGTWSSDAETVTMACGCAACASGKSAKDWGDYEFAYDETGTPVAQSALGTSFTKSSISGDGISLGDKILSGYKWATTELTFSFPNSTSDYGYNDHAGQFSALNAAQKAAARASFDQMEAVSGLTFTEITGSGDRNADLRLAEGGEPSTAWAYYPSSGEWGGDMWYNPQHYNDPSIGSYAFSTFLHEAGHAVGLKHGHDSSFAGALTGSFNSHEYSLMTYHSSVGGNGYYTNQHGHGPQTFMMADIQAMQIMYGANYGTNSGDTTYTFSTSTGEMFVDGVGQGASTANVVFRTLWDGNGTDTYDLSNYSTHLDIDLVAGGYVDFDAAGVSGAAGNFQRARLASDAYAKGHLFNALMFQDDTRSLIENAKGGAGDDEFWGNAAANSFWGNAGTDIFHESTGADQFFGGAGSADRVAFTNARTTYKYAFSNGDLLVEKADGSIDRVGADVEGVRWSSESQDTSFATIQGWLDGGNLSWIDGYGPSTDTGDSDDDIDVDSDADQDADPDADTVAGQTLTGTTGKDDLRGGEGDDVITGLGDNDRLIGNGGNDRINGNGGKDSIYGRAGNDQLWGDGDKDLLSGEAGTDTLYGGDHNDKLYGGSEADMLYGGGHNDKLFGGSQGDQLFGGAGNDHLSGQGDADSLYGGLGKDKLTGGAGSDVMAGGADKDSMRAGTGNDMLLGDAGDDRLDGEAGSDTIDGGAGADRINGGSEDDVLMGGAGNDMLTGGEGADIFVFSTGDEADMIRDFDIAEDFVSVSGLGATALSDFTIVDDRKGVILTLGSDSLQLRKISEAELSADFFLFA